MSFNGGGGGGGGGGAAPDSYWDRLWQVCSVVAILVTLAAVLASVIINSQAASLVRTCFVATAADVSIMGGGEPGALVTGRIEFNWNNDEITYKTRVESSLSAVTAIHIRGPMQLGTRTGPLAAILCGSTGVAGVTPCITALPPGSVAGTTYRIYTGVVVDGTDVRVFIQEYRNNPELFYVEFLTAARPATPGAARAQLTAWCGVP